MARTFIHFCRQARPGSARIWWHLKCSYKRGLFREYKLKKPFLTVFVPTVGLSFGGLKAGLHSILLFLGKLTDLEKKGIPFRQSVGYR